MKLNYKRTILVGFAFFLISAFWQAYDSTVSLLLTKKFGMSQTWSGVIMALDNILALFMLHLFGTLSDKNKRKSGITKRIYRHAFIIKQKIYNQESFTLDSNSKYTNNILIKPIALAFVAIFQNYLTNRSTKQVYEAL